MTLDERWDVVVVGAGVAGLAAAFSSARRGFRTHIVERQAPGGQLALGGVVEDLPVLAEETTGPMLAGRLTEAAHAQGVSFGWGDTLRLEHSPDRWTVITDEGELETLGVVVATGGQETRLGIPGEVELRGRGVSECATCDGPLFAGRRVVVAGSGRWAGHEAAILATMADEVIVFADLAPPVAAPAGGALAGAKTVAWRIGERLVSIVGDESVVGVIVEAFDGSTQELGCDAVFVCTERQPGSSLVDSTSEGGSLGDTPGLFVAGEARTGSTNIAGCLADGAAASEQLARYLSPAGQGAARESETATRG